MVPYCNVWQNLTFSVEIYVHFQLRLYHLKQCLKELKFMFVKKAQKFIHQIVRIKNSSTTLNWNQLISNVTLLLALPTKRRAFPRNKTLWLYLYTDLPRKVCGKVHPTKDCQGAQWSCGNPWVEYVHPVMAQWQKRILRNRSTGSKGQRNEKLLPSVKAIVKVLGALKRYTFRLVMERFRFWPSMWRTQAEPHVLYDYVQRRKGRVIYLIG